MAEAFFSQSWYRVAALKPVLQPHVRAHRHRYRGEGWYVLEDVISGKTHRLNPAAYAVAGRLDGTRTVDEIWLEVAQLLDEHAPTQDDVIALLAQLHAADLLQSGTAPDTSELSERNVKQTRAISRQNLLNPVALRVSLFDPDRLLTALNRVVGPLIGGVGLMLWLMVVVPALLLAAEHWTELTANLADRVFSRDNLLILLVSYPVIKAAHELGHGLVVKKYGAAVHDVGIMLLVFFPVPYVDASGASAFASKWRRAAVGSAGIITEMLLAAFAMYVWLLLEPGVMRALCFNVMLIGGVSTLLVNGNPLLRFDGYYVLADLLEMPNLNQRANRYIGHLFETIAFGADDTRPFNATRGEKVFFVLYAPLSYVYRIVLSASIALFVAQRYFVFGVLLGLWTIGTSIGWPIVKALRHIATSPKLRAHRRRAVAVTAGGTAGALLLLFAVPVPSWSTAEGIVWLPDAAHVRAGTAGTLVRLAVPEGTRVAKGDKLAILDDPVIDARMSSLEWRVRELELKLAANMVKDQVLAATTRIELDDARKQLQREQDRKANMVVESGADGVFATIRPVADLAGRFFKEGEQIGYVLPDRSDTVRVAVQQDAANLVRSQLSAVEIRPSYTDQTLHSRIVRAVPAAQFELPSGALSQVNGGEIPTDPRDPKSLTALTRVFQYDVALAPEAGIALFGARVRVKFSYGYEPVGFQLYRRVRALFLSAFDV